MFEAEVYTSECIDAESRPVRCARASNPGVPTPCSAFRSSAYQRLYLTTVHDEAHYSACQLAATPGMRWEFGFRVRSVFGTHCPNAYERLNLCTVQECEYYSALRLAASPEMQTGVQIQCRQCVWHDSSTQNRATASPFAQLSSLTTLHYCVLSTV